jgi:hypothetical protein
MHMGHRLAGLTTILHCDGEAPGLRVLGPWEVEPREQALRQLHRREQVARLVTREICQASPVLQRANQYVAFD